MAEERMFAIANCILSHAHYSLIIIQTSSYQNEPIMESNS